MDYGRLSKKLTLPVGAAVPRRLGYDDLVATAISRTDLADDIRGINASLALIKQTRGGTWPTGPVSEDYDYVDLVWHEFEFREGVSFSYVVRDAARAYIGCCYFYPMGSRTPLSAPPPGRRPCSGACGCSWLTTTPPTATSWRSG